MKRVILAGALLWALLLTGYGNTDDAVLTGRYLRAENTAPIVVTEDGLPIVLSDRSESGALFEGLTSGDRIEITYDGSIAETWPAQTGAYSCKLLEAGTMDDIPEEILGSLEEQGWDFGRHTHQPAGGPQRVEDPVSGYCGNTVTRVTVNGEEYAFWGSDSVTLTDILINLNYAPAKVCRCMTEYTVDTEFGSGYGVNLTESFARCEAGQAALTAEQTETIRDILTRNCGGAIVTQYRGEDDETHVFSMLWDAAADMTALLDSLSYGDEVCNCIAEYTVQTSSGIRYDVDLAERYVRLDGRQAALTEEQAALLRELFDRSGGI